ncbi:hypothetical protein [Albibacterium profundi]|uniref:Uncharacterized protein n=1 Tax=Albibacterium profundi TaxID=3134906 RepID=A0ABV5CI86_9SPHI
MKDLKITLNTDADKCLFIINALRETEKIIWDIYMCGGCYRFHLFLKKIFPNAKPLINLNEDHCVTLIDDRIFDIEGEQQMHRGEFVTPNGEQLEMMQRWSFTEHNLIQVSECPSCEEPLIYDHVQKSVSGRK